MFKYMLILVFVVGIMCSSSVAFAGGNSSLLGCEATIKCVCHSLFKTRVVPCPTNVSLPFLYPSPGPQGTLGVACSHPLVDSEHARCEDLDIRCHWYERPNCLLTLPLFVAPPSASECGMEADLCGTDSDCCEGLTCSGSSCAACGTSGDPCSSGSDCCSPEFDCNQSIMECEED
jgi:hypothetical protein